MRQPLRASVTLALPAVHRALSLHPDPALRGEITGVATDSRDVQPGDLFVAIVGERNDGHDFLESAVEHGATALLVQRVPRRDPGVVVLTVPDTLAALGELARWWRRRLGSRLIAVTGSNGKSTTKEMIAAVLATHTGDRSRVLVTPGNFNNHVGLPLTLLGARTEQAVGVVELGMSAPGEIDHLTRLAEPEVGLVTNAEEAHLMSFDGVDGVARAKAELWGRLSPLATAVVPADDPRLRSLAAERFCGQQLRFGEAADADVRVLEARSTAEHGLRVTLAAAGDELVVELPLLGRHNGLNAAAAMAACLALGVGLDEVREGLGRTAAMPHRARLLEVHGVAVLDDCYNANPPSLRAGVATLLELPGEGRTAVVVGDLLELGDEGPALHEALGRELGAAGIDVVIGLGELAARLCDGAREGGVADVVHVLDAAAAAQALGERLGAGDRVLVKGSRSMGLEAVIDAWRGATNEPEEAL